MKELDITSEIVRSTFKNKLHDLRAEIILKLDELRADVVSHKEIGSDLLDQAAGIEERDRFLAEMNRESIALQKIELAIKNFEDFGFCLDCGEEITIRRLNINPAITTCIDCQEKSERLAKGHAR